MREALSRFSGEKSILARMASSISFDKSIIAFPPTLFAKFAMVVNVNWLQMLEVAGGKWTAEFIKDRMKSRGEKGKEGPLTC